MTINKIKVITLLILVLIASCNPSENRPQDPNNQPPSVFDLISIADNTSGLNINQISFSWEVPFDPDGDDTDIRYDLYIGTDPNNINLLVAWDLINPNYTVIGRFNTCTTYYWNIKAKDKEGGETLSTSTFKFTTRDININNSALTTTAPFPKRHSHQTIVYDNKMWLIAGTTTQDISSVKVPYNDVWYSIDGIEWEEVTPNAPFSKRYNHSALTFKDKMWVIGGIGGQLVNLKNEVWYSTDGWNWTEVINQVGLPDINRNKAVVFKDKIFLFSDNKVWSSDDATSWVSVTDNAGFSSRYGYSVTVFNDELWVVGGATSASLTAQILLNDVWKSQDGITWTQTTINAPFKERLNHATTVFDDKLFVIAGQDNPILGEANDIWFTKDGQTWTQVTDNAPFDERTEHTATTFNDRIYVIAGADNSLESQGLNDVWTLD